MAIVKRPAQTAPAEGSEEAVERFIRGAPDGGQPAKASPQEESEKGVQITLRIAPTQLARITAAAKRQGIPRASYIKRAIALQLEEDERA